MKTERRLPRLSQLTVKAKVGLGLVVLVVIGAAATLIITSIIGQQIKTSTGTSEASFAKKSTTDRQKDALDKADAAIQGGSQENASIIYDQAIAAEKDPTRKVLLAIDQSALLASAGKVDDAIAVGKSAESYGKDKYLISDWMGRLYESNKQYADAATYYGQAADLADSPTNDKGYNKKYYEGKVTTMKSLEGKV